MFNKKRIAKLESDIRRLEQSNKWQNEDILKHIKSIQQLNNRIDRILDLLEVEEYTNKGTVLIDKVQDGSV